MVFVYNTSSNQKKWKISDGKVAFYRSAHSAFGIKNDQGLFLSSDGVRPAAFDTKKAAAMQAPYADGFKGHSWVKVLN